ncbi:phosphatidylethanolamine-binding protein [Teratosphaeria destructans]|uniref:Phosphatidylethanolamine-binding protein n=1 Tax=Teratosphaeria destructans TaxID=418781 RepID=A0A9W7W7E3_9PEZI|nr:phosphatidylethanolamine-binding protein [Teratosphaeria destructans]
MVSERLLGLLLVASAACPAVAVDQEPLRDPALDTILADGSNADVADDILQKLKVAEIIPTVLDPFDPKLTISVSWPDDVTAELGNTLDPSETQKAPKVHFTDLSSDIIGLASVQLTIAMTDPDAPSRDDPKWSEIAHWIATNVPLKDAAIPSSKLRDVIEYKPPGPPPKTGKHRYVFAALVPRNGTTEKLELSKPSDRKHWGYEQKRRGLKNWAEENGLVVIGANFVYEQNKQQ